MLDENLNFKLNLKNNICQFDNTVRYINFINENTILGIADDNFLRVWVKIEQPVVQFKLIAYQSIIANASSSYFYKPALKIFVGLMIGLISEFEISENFQTITYKRNYNNHDGPINAIFYSSMNELVISGGHDKLLFWHNSSTGLLSGSLQNQEIITSLDFDSATKVIFIGDIVGDIHLIKIEEVNGYKPMSVLREHTNSVTQLLWDPENLKLYSGSDDGVIIAWDIGGKTGKIIQLSGHVQKITKILLSESRELLLSSSMDNMVIAWNIKAPREEPTLWKNSDYCEKCKTPFFWNFKSMIEDRILGVRQHHCRKCGRALCIKCCDEIMRIPELGYEIPVRVCQECHSGSTPATSHSLQVGQGDYTNVTASTEITSTVKTLEQSSLPSSIHSSTAPEYQKHSTSSLKPRIIVWSVYNDMNCSVLSMDMNEADNLLITSGTDKMIRVWDMNIGFD